MRSWAWRAVQWLLGLAVIVLAVRQLARNWDELRAQPLPLVLDPWLLLAAAAVIWSVYGVQIWSWRTMLQGWGQRLDYWGVARIWTISGLGKYLPGKVWTLAGLVVLARRAGVAGWAAAGVSIMLQLVALGTGALATGLTGAVALEAAQPGATAALIALGVLSAASVALLAWPPFLQRALRFAGVAAEDVVRPPTRALLAGIGANLLAWIGYGVALQLLAHGLFASVALELPEAIAAYTAAYVAGFLAILAPGGLGVREGVLILLLQRSIGLGPAAALALASRVLLTLTELGAAAPFLLFAKRSTRVAI